MTDRRTLSRRAFLGAAAGGAAVVGAAGLATSGGFGALAGGRRRRARRPRQPGPTRSPAPHQAGIVTPAQDRMYTAAFDLTTTSRDELVALLRTWTTMAARLSAGLSAGPFGPTSGPYDAPPDDTGEAQELRRGRAHAHDRVRAVAVHRAGADAEGDRFGHRPSPARRARRAPPLPGRRPPADAQRRRPHRPGVRRRPAGRDARRAQPDPGGVRHGARPLVAAGLRADVLHLAAPRSRRAT